MSEENKELNANELLIIQKEKQRKKEQREQKIKEFFILIFVIAVFLGPLNTIFAFLSPQNYELSAQGNL